MTKMKNWLQYKVGIVLRLLQGRFLLGSIIFIPTALLYGLFLWTVPAPRFWVSLSVASERVSFRVANPDFALIKVTGMEAFSLNKKWGCVNGIVTPAPGANIEYRRGSDDYFRIIIDAPSASPGAAISNFDSLDSNTKRLQMNGSVLFKAKKECGSPPLRLPIWGPAVFGERLTAEGDSGDVTPGILTQGKIEVYAHAQDRLLGIRFPPSIYSVQTFDLPAGSMLTSTENTANAWVGIANVPTGGASGFSVLASTASAEVSLQLPNSPIGVGPQKIALGQYSQNLKDPNIVQLQFLFGVFIFLFQTVMSLTNYLKTAEQEDILRSIDQHTAEREEKPSLHSTPH